MRKTVTHTTTRQVVCCDLCERDVSNGFGNTCWVSQREVCLKCSKLLFPARGGDLIELGIKVCASCQEFPLSVKKVGEILDRANRDLREATGVWKAAAKPSA